MRSFEQSPNLNAMQGDTALVIVKQIWHSGVSLYHSTFSNKSLQTQSFHHWFYLSLDSFNCCRSGLWWDFCCSEISKITYALLAGYETVLSSGRAKVI